MKRTLMLAALAVLIASPAFAGTISFAPPDRLATLVEGASDTNYSNFFYVGYGGNSSAANRPIFSFDVSALALPANGYVVGTSTVNSLTLTLITDTDNSWTGSLPVAFDLKLWDTDPLNTNWGAGTATWDTQDGTNNWAGTQRPNNSFGSLGTPLDSETVTSTASGQTITFTVSNPAVLTPLINGWLAGSNAGLFMATDFTDVNRYLSMVTSGGNAPALEITFTNVPEPGTFAMLLFGSVMLWVVKRKRG